MSFMERFTKSKADAEPQPSEANAPESKPAPLRDVLIEKLREKAEQGDIAAIKLLLDSPELCEPDVPKDLESAKASLIQFLRDLADQSTEPENLEETKRNFLEYVRQWGGKFPDLLIEIDERCLRVKEAPRQVEVHVSYANDRDRLTRAGISTADHDRKLFEHVLRNRLDSEADKAELLRRWDSLPAHLKTGLWTTILECLRHPEGEDELLAKTETTIQ